jgi:ubiquitin-protein ligase
MKVTVAVFGKVEDYEHDENDPILGLQSKVAAKYKIDYCDVRFVFKGLALDYNEALAYYKYTPESVLFTVFDRKAVDKMRVDFPTLDFPKYVEPVNVSSDNNTTTNDNNNNNNNNNKQPVDIPFTKHEAVFNEKGFVSSQTKITLSSPEVLLARMLGAKDSYGYSVSTEGNTKTHTVYLHGEEFDTNPCNADKCIWRCFDREVFKTEDKKVVILLNFLRRVLADKYEGGTAAFLMRVKDIGGNPAFVWTLARYLDRKAFSNVAMILILFDGFKQWLNDIGILSDMTSDLARTQAPLFPNIDNTLDPRILEERTEDAKFVLKPKERRELDLKKNPAWFVYPPNALMSYARKPALTVNANGEYVIYTGKTKMENVTNKVYITDCNGNIDVEMNIDDAMKSIVDKKIELTEMEQIEVSEISVVCLDLSLSMKEPLKESDAEDIQLMRQSFKPDETLPNEGDVRNLLYKWGPYLDTLTDEWLKKMICASVLADIYASHARKAWFDAASVFLGNPDNKYKPESAAPDAKLGKRLAFVLWNKVFKELWITDETDAKTQFGETLDKFNNYELISYKPVTAQSKPRDLFVVSNRHLFGKLETITLKCKDETCTFMPYQPVADIFQWILHKVIKRMANSAIEIYKNKRVVDGSTYVTFIYISLSSIGYEFSDCDMTKPIEIDWQFQNPQPDAEYDKAIDNARAKVVNKIDLAKIMFNSYVDRLSAFDLPHALGFVTFNDTAKIELHASQSVELFRDRVNSVKLNGNTAFYDAVAKAVEVINTYKGKQKPNVVKRIIVLTDGIDTSSKTTAREMNILLKNNNVWLDVVSFSVSNESKNMLGKVSGASFFVKSERDVIDLAESETFLTLSLRQKRERFYEKTNSRMRVIDVDSDDDDDNNNNHNTHNYEGTEKINVDEFFNDLKQLGELAPPLDLKEFKRTKPRADNDVAFMRRITKELKEVEDQKHAGYVIMMNTVPTLDQFDVVFKGPEGTPYHGYRFKMAVVYEGDYPSKPPTCRFYPPSVLHANISMHGKVCHSVLDRNWTPDTTLYAMLNCIYGLFLTPEPLDPLNSSVASLMLASHETYMKVVKRWVALNCEKEQIRCWSCGNLNPKKRCSACKQARYCNEECQTKDWTDRHKRVCIRK